jgi:hypothetical protein
VQPETGHLGDDFEVITDVRGFCRYAFARCSYAFITSARESELVSMMTGIASDQARSQDIQHSVSIKLREIYVEQDQVGTRLIGMSRTAIHEIHGLCAIHCRMNLVRVTRLAKCLLHEPHVGWIVFYQENSTRPL